MSLPPAQKEIGPHPSKLSVTSPNDPQAMQADVDRKLHLYGVIQAFRQNKYPDNKQIDETLKYVIEHSPVDQSKLSPDGRRLIQDVQDILQTTRVMVKEKNADELFQNFLCHTSYADVQVPKATTEAVDVSQEDVKKDHEQAVEHLRTLLRLVLSNSEARKLLSDASLIGRDLFARGAVRIAEKARPHEADLARADDAAPSDEWKTDKTDEDLSKLDTTGQDAQRKAGEAKDTVKGEVEGLRQDVRGKGDVREQGETAKRSFIDRLTGGVKEQVPTETREQAGLAAEENRGVKEDVSKAKTDDLNEQAEVAKKSLKDRFNGLMEKVPQDHRDTAREQYDKGIEFLKEEFPEERRDQFIYRIKKVIVECQKHSDYQDALNWFIGAIETYYGHGRTLGSHHADKANENLGQDPTLQRAGNELRTLLERFANGKSLDDIFHAADQLNKDAQNDEGLKQWFSDFDAYVRKTLLEPGFVLAPQCNTEANKLRERGRAFFEAKYKGHKDALFDAIQAWFVAWGDDRLNKRFGNDWKRLTRDLLFSEEGNLTFKPALWEDIRKVIVPQLAQHVGYVPIPRIEYTDNQLDLVIENLTLQGKNILPNVVSIDAHNHFSFSPYDAISDVNRHEFKFTFSQIQMDMRDVAFWFHKKGGIPKIRDSGLADVLLGGEGLTVKIHLTDAGRDPKSVFGVKDISVKVDSLKFSVRDTKHDVLYKTLKPLATGLVKKQIQKAINDAVRTGLEYLDEQLVAVRDKYNEAKQSDDISRTQVLSSLFEKKKDDTTSLISSGESSGARKSQFKIVAKRESSLIPNTGYESGWIGKIAEREAAASTGEGWRSEAFNIIPGSYVPGGGEGAKEGQRDVEEKVREKEVRVAGAPRGKVDLGTTR
ncbi:uncharacterized protein EI90DRAFT_2930862 [Cantharellus anzutake]|uniref:uncharacterized protein n=1 Tax=Cantharellus anzutake TaxID=1750568 RepID=UPI0019041D60|nr:uncharacterized protein EI90DRAFT_2930862 [Cantharellus anzutake]KAF8326038.1 hypothetical protein EI90DRAFT_2930862 [Cantharellus anzutake]